MYSKGFILPCIVIFFCNLSSNFEGPNFVSALFETCERCNEKILSFHAVSDEMFLLKYTGRTVEVCGSPTTKSTVTSGIFDKEVYTFYKLIYYWKKYDFTNTFVLQVQDIYFNSKYQNYKNALNYPDGIVKIIIPVYANGNIDNPNFNKFEKAMNEIKHSGKSTYIPSLDSYSWFINYPPYSTYTYYKSSYYDEDTKKYYNCATTISVPMFKQRNFISRRQFINTFGSLVESWKLPENNLALYNAPTSPISLGFGVKINGIQVY